MSAKAWEFAHRWLITITFGILFAMFVSTAYVVQRQGDRIREDQSRLDDIVARLADNQEDIFLLYFQVCDSRRDAANRTAALLKDILVIVKTDPDLTKRVGEAIAASQAGVICPQEPEGTP